MGATYCDTLHRQVIIAPFKSLINVQLQMPHLLEQCDVGLAELTATAHVLYVAAFFLEILYTVTPTEYYKDGMTIGGPTCFDASINLLVPHVYTLFNLRLPVWFDYLADAKGAAVSSSAMQSGALGPSLFCAGGYCGFPGTT
jgi:hypothetical protein